MEHIELEAKKEIGSAKNSQELEALRIKYLGRKGRMAELLLQIKDLSNEERAQRGKQINQLKRELEELFEKKKNEIKNSESNKNEKIDVTAPGRALPFGHLHPRTLILRQVEKIFQSLGFSVVDSSEMETDYYNFQALNFPKDHPARDMQDTFYIDDELLLRTQTSPNQVRYMEKHNPPLRVIVPGKVFRRDASDATHESQFYQVEGLMVDKNISIGNFKAVILEFFKQLFGKEVKIRLRPSFFPFTEPSFEPDIQCVFCDGKGCRVCKNTGWIEMAGAGMVHPFVFKSAGYAPYEWQGFAFGFGLDRLAMMKYKIDDLRMLNFGDMRFLRQF
ncbi:MAG: phenylalanine--tRNA ligase subunit alpha [Candidatus Portnoybacteria bacterium]|nr:phenylalanine--tRNA ligase subunit alpha [Candidatus Portnoybacteria bacterium]